MKPTRIVVHNTANDASAVNEISYMRSNSLKVSFHYAVDDKEIVQGIPENRNAWHAGDGNGKGNREGIGIEICYSKSGGDRFIKAEQNAAWFISTLLKKYGWGIDKVTKHQDYMNKYCPHRTLDMGWQRFLNIIKDNMANKFNYELYVKNNNLYMRILSGSIKENITVKNLTKGTSWKVFAEKSVGNDGGFINQGMEACLYEVIAKGVVHQYDNRKKPEPTPEPPKPDPKDQKIAELEEMVKNQAQEVVELKTSESRLFDQLTKVENELGGLKREKLEWDSKENGYIAQIAVLEKRLEELTKVREPENNLFVRVSKWLQKVVKRISENRRN